MRFETDLLKRLSNEEPIFQDRPPSPDLVGKLNEFITYIENTAESMAGDPVYPGRFDRPAKETIERYLDNTLRYLLDNLDVGLKEKPKGMDPLEFRVQTLRGRYGSKVRHYDSPEEKRQLIEEYVTELFGTLEKYCRLVIRG